MACMQDIVPEIRFILNYSNMLQNHFLAKVYLLTFSLNLLEQEMLPDIGQAFANSQNILRLQKLA